ncbi:hypothetical protein BD626DRAFT_169470 [Schizophyllum amplum]|uniref:Uncharacterized protein n=1 Tax=Schizophyllum amplum TaxID=97359 RepID=A0A550CQQ4_9AGAR|nr:hypothetical protein BD626DRAFT_169470 [Auriculariopsis ampla]
MLTLVVFVVFLPPVVFADSWPAPHLSAPQMAGVWAAVAVFSVLLLAALAYWLKAYLRSPARRARRHAVSQHEEHVEHRQRRPTIILDNPRSRGRAPDPPPAAYYGGAGFRHQSAPQYYSSA